MDESKALTDKYNQIQQWAFEDKMKTNDQIMEQARFGWDAEDRAMGRMTDIISTTVAGGGTLDSISTTEKAKYEASAGLPAGYFDMLFNANQKVQEAQNLQTEVELQELIVNLRAKMPEGMKFKIGDTYYEGWHKEDPNTWQSVETNEFGDSTLVWFDQNTKEYGSIPLGRISAMQGGYDTEWVDGTLYRINRNIGTAEPVVLKGGEIDPAKTIPGFREWAETMGDVTVEFGGGTNFEGHHPGWDIANKVGTPITPFVAGQVTKVDPVGAGGFGKFIEVTDAEGRVHRYSHLNSINVAMGSSVAMGQIIGGMGNTGNVITTRGGTAHEPNDQERAAGAGAHLDYRVFAGGSALTSSSEGTAVEGLTSQEVSAVQSDVNMLLAAVQAGQTTVPTADGGTMTISQAFNSIRDSIGMAGNSARTWFDGLYDPERFGITEEDSLGTFADYTSQAPYTAENISSPVAPSAPEPSRKT